MVVAVLDTGLRTTHEDIVGRIAPGGFDFGDNDADVTDTDGHGSHCIGIIGANTNNGKGVASVAYNTKVLPIKVFGSNPTGDPVVQGIMAAADRGAKIISMSFGTYTFPQAWQDAVNYAWGKGCLLFATAGNDNINMKRYPGACANVITMGSTDQNDQKSGFSNWGDWVLLAAPGSNIRSFGIASDISYTDLSGTSMACPFAASVGALVWGRNPALSNAQVRDILFSTADPVGSFVSKGRVNAHKAALKAVPLSDYASTTLLSKVGVVGGISEGTAITPYASDFAAGVATNATDAGRYILRSRYINKVGGVASLDTIVRVTTPLSAIKSAKVELVSKGPVPASTFVFAYNYASGAFDQIGQVGNTNAERTTSVSFDVSTFGKYLNSSGHVRLLVRSISPVRAGQNAWNIEFNRVSVIGGFDSTLIP
jgi:thermitase